MKTQIENLVKKYKIDVKELEMQFGDNLNNNYCEILDEIEGKIDVLKEVIRDLEFLLKVNKNETK